MVAPTDTVEVDNSGALDGLTIRNPFCARHTDHRELSVRVPRAVFGGTYFASLSGGLTLMNSLSHFWCLPDLVGRLPGKVRSNSWRAEIRSCAAHRQLGSFWLLDPATCYPKSLIRPL